jgi:MFS family permease
MTAIALSAEGAFKAWAWRIPFLASLVLVAIGLWVRLKVMESPLFDKVVEEKKVERVPVAQVLRRHPKEIALSALVRMSEQAPFYVFTSFALTYIHEHLHKTQGLALLAISLAGVVELILIPVFGNLSDAAGRRRIYMIGAVLMGVIAFPYFGLLNTGVGIVIVIAAILAAIPHAIQYGPQAAYIAENFPTGLAYGGSGIGYQTASLIAGGPAPLIATWLLHDYGWNAIAIYIIACAIVTLAASVLLTDRGKAEIPEVASVSS